MTAFEIVAAIVLGVGAWSVVRSLRAGKQSPPPPGTSRTVASLYGDGSFAVPVVGESHYQDAISRAVGGITEEGADAIVDAEVILENENPHDPNAVKVAIGGRTVGYLERDFAPEFRRQIQAKAPGHTRFPCKARVRGGWDRGPNDRGQFGVRLDIVTGAPESGAQR